MAICPTNNSYYTKNGLTKRNTQIYDYYKEGISMRQLAEQYGIINERIRQIIKKRQPFTCPTCGKKRNK